MIIHVAIEDETPDDPADTVTASANADRAAELAAEARAYNWRACQHLRTDRDSTRCPDCDAELVYEIRGRCDDSD